MTSLFDRHQAVFGAGAPLFYDDPVQLVSGEGVWLTGADGVRYLDLYNNVPCVGHGNPRVAAAVAAQVAKLNVHSRYLHESVVDWAERLVGLHHQRIESAVIACTGTEANDVAITMARTATARHGIIGTDATYHGNSPTVGSLERLPAGSDRNGFRSVSTPQRFRPPEAGMSDDALLDHHMTELERAIATLEAEGHGVAGLMLCSILANEGLPTPPTGWFEQATSMVRAAGGLIIADEVQAGFARSGSWWGYETNNFEPDIVTMGKPMGNGVPVSAAAASRELVDGYRDQHRYFNTYAGTPIQAAASNAVIDEIIDRDLVASAASVGAELRQGLDRFAETDERMGDVRGCGLFFGVDWVHPGTTDPDVEGAARMVEALKDRGVLMGKAGQYRNVLKLRPPLVFESEHAALFLEAFADALEATRL